MKKLKEKIGAKAQPFDYYFGKPRIELSMGECLIDGIESVVEYSPDKISLSLGDRLVTFWGDGMKINSFTSQGMVVRGNIVSMEFSQEFSQ